MYYLRHCPVGMAENAREDEFSQQFLASMFDQRGTVLEPMNLNKGPILKPTTFVCRFVSLSLSLECVFLTCSLLFFLSYFRPSVSLSLKENLSLSLSLFPPRHSSVIPWSDGPAWTSAPFRSGHLDGGTPLRVSTLHSQARSQGKLAPTSQVSCMLCNDVTFLTPAIKQARHGTSCVAGSSMQSINFSDLLMVMQRDLDIEQCSHKYRCLATARTAKQEDRLWMDLCQGCLLAYAMTCTRKSGQKQGKSLKVILSTEVILNMVCISNLTPTKFHMRADLQIPSLLWVCRDAFSWATITYQHDVGLWWVSKQFIELQGKCATLAFVLLL